MTTPPGCRAARLDLLTGHEADATHVARSHLEECPACRAFVAGDRALVARLRAVDRRRAPGPVAGAVHVTAARYARRRLRRHRLLQVALPIAAALMLALPFRGRSPTVDEVVVLATTQRMARPAISAETPEAVSAWLRRRWAMEVDVPGIGGARVLAARSLTVRGMPAALVFYRMGADTLTYVSLMGAVGPGARLPDSLYAMGAGPYRIVVWEEPGGLRAVAAAMPEDAVMAVAAECRAKALMRGS